MFLFTFWMLWATIIAGMVFGNGVGVAISLGGMFVLTVWMMVALRPKHFKVKASAAEYSFNVPSVEVTVGKPSFRDRLIRWFRAS